MNRLIHIATKGLAFAGLALIAAGTMAGVGVARDPSGTDRPGGDIQRSVLPQADPELCVRQCMFDQRCASYTYVRPGLQDKQAVCYLKNSQRRIVKNSCCESGRKIGVQDKRRPEPPARIQPPESMNKQWCTTNIFCADKKKGHWSDERQVCDCDPLKGLPEPSSIGN